MRRGGGGRSRLGQRARLGSAEVPHTRRASPARAPLLAFLEGGIPRAEWTKWAFLVRLDRERATPHEAGRSRPHTARHLLSDGASDRLRAKPTGRALRRPLPPYPRIRWVKEARGRAGAPPMPIPPRAPGEVRARAEAAGFAGCPAGKEGADGAVAAFGPDAARIGASGSRGARGPPPRKPSLEWIEPIGSSGRSPRRGSKRPGALGPERRGATGTPDASGRGILG